MNDFLEQVWLDNKVKHYLIVAGVILFVWLLKRFISRYLAGLLYTVVHRVWKDLEKQSFVKLVIRPLGFFLAVLISVIALYKLNFPAELNVDVYKYTAKEIIQCIGNIILIVSFTSLLIRIIDFIALILEKRANLTQDQTDNQLIVFFKDFFRVILIIIGAMLVLRYAFGLDVGGLLTGLSIVGAAIALALRESLENLIASFIIFFDKPFITGDIVKVQSVSGTVEKIGLRSTRIRTEQKTLVTVPNKQMVDSMVDNQSLRIQRRGDLRLEPDVRTSPETLLELTEGIKKILAAKGAAEYSVHISELTANAAVIVSDYYMPPVNVSEFNEIKQDINLQVLMLLDKLQVKTAATIKEVKI